MTAAAVSSPLSAAELMAWAEDELMSVTDTARMEAELLLAEVAGIGRAAVIAQPQRRLSFEQVSRLEAVVARRSRGEPLAYIVGCKEFYSLRLSICPDVLVPRPETETLVDAVLQRRLQAGTKVLELGTGSGAIALALKNERPDFDITAVDCDAAALAVACANAADHNLDIRWLQSDWYAAVAGQRFDLVISNPPYVPSLDPHFEQGLAHEPRVALDGGEDGLDAYRAIFGDAGNHLVPGGWLLLEHGFDQRQAVTDLAVASGYRLDAGIDDLSGLPRVACFCEAIS